MKALAIQRLRGAILRDTSRSFYLTLRLLPRALRDPISLAYLLARATDTIADTVQIDAALRARELASLAARIQGNAASGGSLHSFAALQKDAAERALIEAVPACVEWLEALPGADRRDIRSVLAHINEGQTLDVQRITALGSDELDRYTYLVAGCVGEFWTQVCFRHLPRFAQRPIDEMMGLGIDYGKGLQLVNILRDIGADLRAGRRYLDAEEIDVWRDRASHKLGMGIDYACAIRPLRVRLATALPALIGARTLALLRDAGPAVFERKIKISRAEVRQIILRAMRTLASPSSLRATFRDLSS